MPKSLDVPSEDESINYYTKEQLINFLKCLENENNYKAYTLFRLLSFSGMRKGEALALQWNDLNFKDGEIVLILP
ncbi:tyrosine-type recombinase/integrase [Lysinibacillus xylanilyticus]|uniref:tyrosine-type recombinase/integrase n=1 Tax=Lysinibacillus xylanilyticus TaxID=582475 RepID=UPI002B24E62E|nr:tyrosine-type recombinase/integrase [Lysinibacillus xylanilyticus]MEB2280070.1 tyrosine-type recombinase/integrase [Lysinibacillus xylanilyticus]